ncbi:microfibril-associated glycoprotein 4-like [Amphiura filiformis]|uniref:microfibril-associated glycoprotein 4-like n=1 Tax=Amphiura filiformis TaxID=82378 RepID=UPI003B217593
MINTRPTLETDRIVFISDKSAIMGSSMRNSAGFVFLFYAGLCVIAINAQVDSGGGTTDTATEHTTAEEELLAENTVETLVNLICDCKIKETCGQVTVPEPQDCYDLLQQGHTKSGKYTIYPFGNDGPLLVYCDMESDGGGWTVFQKREDDSVDFYRDWDEYREGFGYIGSDYWLGNKYIFLITNQERYELRVDLEDFAGETRYAKYDHFRVSDEATNYKLSLGTYSGTAGDSMTTYHAGMAFTTKDRDNDQHSTDNCAVVITSAWWYKDCFRVDLNAQYLHGAHDQNWRGVIWDAWKGHQYSLRRTEMKIRPHGI